MAISNPQYAQDKGYTAALDRGLLADMFNQGVVRPGHLHASVLSSTTVRVAPGIAFVTRQGVINPESYRVAIDNFVDVPFVRDSSFPRIDMLALKVFDSQLDNGETTRAELQVLPGTPTAGANLLNQTGMATATSLPDRTMRIVAVLVPTTGDITLIDRRPWARGAYASNTLTDNGAAGITYTTTSSTVGAFDINNLPFNLELSGLNPVRVIMNGYIATSTHGLSIQPRIDSANIESGFLFQQSTLTRYFHWEHRITVSPGPHHFDVMWSSLTNGEASTLFASPTLPFQFAAEEILTSDQDNA